MPTCAHLVLHKNGSNQYQDRLTCATCGKKLAEIYSCVPVEDLDQLPPVRNLIQERTKVHQGVIRSKDWTIHALRQKIRELEVQILLVRQELEDLAWHEITEQREIGTQTE